MMLILLRFRELIWKGLAHGSAAPESLGVLKEDL
jgi:hypothetical protein